MNFDEPDKRTKNITLLEIAEMQFRLSSAVRLATTSGTQPIDLPQQWSHGKHVISYEEIALHPKEAEKAACYLQRSSTYMMAMQIRNALAENFKSPKSHDDKRVRDAYQISRLVRNAFAHNPFYPVWSVDEDCRNKRFEVTGIIEIDTTNLHGTVFDWRHYGGPLALLKLSYFVRRELLGDDRVKPAPPPRSKEMHQQGNLILTKADDSDDE